MKIDDAKSGVTLVRDVREDWFKQLEYSELPKSIRDQSENYLTMFLKPGALPRNATKLVTKMFAAQNPNQDDLIEFQWMFEGHQLRLVESLNAVKLQIEFAQAPIAVQDAKALIERILNTTGVDAYGNSYAIEFKWPRILSDNTRVSSNPSTDIMRINSWHDRVDADVQGRTLDLLLYKKVPQLIGYQDGSMWFKKYWN